METKKIHNGFWVAIGAFASIFFVGSGVKVFLLFLPEFERIGFSIGTVSSLSVLAPVSVFVSGMFVSKVLKKIGVKLTMLIGMLLMATAYFLFSIAINPLVISISFVCMGISVTFSSYTPATILINRWFDSKRALVLSIVFMGMSVGSAMYSAIAGWLLDNYNFQVTSIVIALMIIVFASIPIFLFVKESPEKLGQVPYSKGEKKTAKAQGKIQLLDYSTKQASKTFAFWRIVIITLIAAATLATIQSYLPAHLQFEGMAPIASSRIYSIMMLASAPSTILGGFIAEKYSTKIFILYTALLLIAGTALIIIVPTSFGIMVFAALAVGIAYPLCNITPSLLMNDTFSKKTFDGLIGILQASMAAAAGILFPAVGFAYEYFNSYKVPLWGLIALIAIMIIFTLTKTNKKNVTRSPREH